MCVIIPGTAHVSVRRNKPTNKNKKYRAVILSVLDKRGGCRGRKESTIKGMVHRERGEERREGTEEEEDGREAEKRGDVTSNRQPMGVREGGRERGRRRVCFSITAASAERRGAQSISHRRGRKKGTSRREEGGKKRDAGRFQRRGAHRGGKRVNFYF